MQPQSVREQGGLEARSVELERLIDQGRTLIDTLNGFEMLRDSGAEHFESLTGSAWRPYTASVFNHTTRTAAIIDSRTFLKARQKEDRQLSLPEGPRVSAAGGRTTRTTSGFSPCWTS